MTVNSRLREPLGVFGFLRLLDAGIARGEVGLATAFLLAMIVAASAQAVFRNLNDAGFAFATASLPYLTWVDPFLKKGTLWLAFLGASLATREGRHIGIDLLPRLLPRRSKQVLRGVTGLAAGVVSFFLARAFWAAVLVNAQEGEAYQIYAEEGLVHLCDATPEALEAARLAAPSLFCSVRSSLSVLGIPVETPEATLQLVVPVLFVVIAARLVANGLRAFLQAAGVLPDAVLVAEELAASDGGAEGEGHDGADDADDADEGEGGDDAGAGEGGDDAGGGDDADEDPEERG